MAIRNTDHNEYHCGRCRGAPPPFAIAYGLLAALFVLLVFLREYVLNHFSFLSSNHYDAL